MSEPVKYNKSERDDGHRIFIARKPSDGRRKSKVRVLFDEQGSEAAWVLGLKLKLRKPTLRRWFAAWRGSSN